MQRLNLIIEDEVVQRLQVLEARMGASSTTEVIRRSLRLAERLTKPGLKLYVGKAKEIIIV